MTRYLLPAIIVFMVGGVFLAPTYNYTYEEKLRLKRQPALYDHVTWPVRAYQNWIHCGAISYCEKVRCAALEGGCQDLGTGRPPKITPRESNPEFRKQVEERYKHIEVKPSKTPQGDINVEKHIEFQKRLEERKKDTP